MKRKKILFLTIIAIVLIMAIVAVSFLLHRQRTEAYTVTFQDFNGTILKFEIVKSGESASGPANPKREGYTFMGWNKDYSSVTKDTVITAEYIRITEATFTVETIAVMPDVKTMEIKVSVTNNPGILGMVFSVNYDEGALKLIDCQNGVALSALTFQEPSRYVSGCNFVWYGSETGEVMDGEMLILTFEIAENAEPGTYPISISWDDRDIYDSNCDMVDPNVTQGAIVIN